MLEQIAAERFINGTLCEIAGPYGLMVRKGPFTFQPQENSPGGAAPATPVLVFIPAGGRDVGYIGQNGRTGSYLRYHIGVFHPSESMGASFPTPTNGPVTLKTLLARIDDLFEKSFSPVTNEDGVIGSTEREAPLTIQEVKAGRIYYTHGGTYVLGVTAND